VLTPWRPLGLKAGLALGVGWALVVPALALGDWQEPVVAPVNQSNGIVFATAMRGNGSEPLVGLLQFSNDNTPTSAPSTANALVGSLRSLSWNLSAPLDRNLGGNQRTGPRFTPEGPVYAVWSEVRGRTYPATYEVYVARYAGASTWTPVAASLNHNETQSASSPTIANVGGSPWVAWQEAADGVWVARLDGGNVSYVGAAIPGAANPSLTSVNGVAYLAYTTPGPSNPSGRVHVATFENGGWYDVPGLGASGFSPTITNVGGVIWVAWLQGDANGHAQLYTARYVGNGHWIASPSLNIDGNESASSPQIASVGDVPWIVWSESSRPYANGGILEHVFVKQFSGSTWDQVGGVVNVDPNQSAYAGGIADVAGTAYVAMTQSQTDGGTAVRVKSAHHFGPYVSALTTSPAHTTMPQGTVSHEIRFRLVLSKPATVRLDFTQPVNGRRDRGICVAATRHNAHRQRCAQYVSRGVVSFHGHAGANTFLFDETVSHHKHLKRGAYRVVITATDRAGLRSVSRTVHVTL
jgi:hypothetical protein